MWRERERGPFIVMLILRRGQTWVGRDRARARGRAITAASENVGGICLERANYSFTMSREHLEGGAGSGQKSRSSQTRFKQYGKYLGSQLDMQAVFVWRRFIASNRIRTQRNLWAMSNSV